MKITKPWMIATMILVGVLAISLSREISDTTRSVSGVTNSYADEKTELLDLSTATADQPTALPGIGDAYSNKIIEHRPYMRKDELVQKKVIPQAPYDKIKDQIVVKQK